MPDRSRPRHSGPPKKWEEHEEKLLVLLFEQELDYSEIAKQLPGRTAGAVQARLKRWREAGNSFRPFETERPLGDGDLEPIRALLAAGKSAAKIAAELHRCRKSVMRFIHRNNLRPEPVTPVELHPERSRSKFTPAERLARAQKKIWKRRCLSCGVAYEAKSPYLRLCVPCRQRT